MRTDSPQAERDGENVVLTMNATTMLVLHEALKDTDTFKLIEQAGVRAGDSYFGALRRVIEDTADEYNREQQDSKIVQVWMTQGKARELGLAYTALDS